MAGGTALHPMNGLRLLTIRRTNHTVFDRCQFVANQAAKAQGGSVAYLANTTSSSITGSTFAGNSAPELGCVNCNLKLKVMYGLILHLEMGPQWLLIASSFNCPDPCLSYFLRFQAIRAQI